MSESFEYLDIVFDGPPSQTAGRFVEVESPDGRSVRLGEWLERPDGFWALRIPNPAQRAAVERAADWDGYRNTREYGEPGTPHQIGAEKAAREIRRLLLDS